MSTPIGQEWLKRHYSLTNFTLTHASFIGSSPNIELTSKGNVEETFVSRYAVDPIPLNHVEFSLKYDDLNLDFLSEVFLRIPEEDFMTFIDESPAGMNTRRIGYLFEFLTGKTLALRRPVSGNYVDLLDPERYITGEIQKNSRWRVNDNLLGTAAYCPVVRKTKELSELLKSDIRQQLSDLKKDYAPEVFQRAISYLYKKETRSSYNIENEEPSPDRIKKFIALLTKAGGASKETTMSEQRLVLLQNAIVDDRYKVNGFRDFQNYVGASLPNGIEDIDYICPPPSLVNSLMQGLQDVALKSTPTNAALRAAILSFGFVFIHPFEDGNGRIHRFIIHDILASDNLVPQGMIIPVSAHMLNNMHEYNAVLERYSRPLMRKIAYERREDISIHVTNLQTVEGYFRYPDLTSQCVYLLNTINSTLVTDMPDEIRFIQRYDEAKLALQKIVDMPDKDINLMLMFLHQNSGVFPKRRRDRFSKLTDEEIVRMQNAYRIIHELGDV